MAHDPNLPRTEDLGLQLRQAEKEPRSGLWACSRCLDWIRTDPQDPRANELGLCKSCLSRENEASRSARPTQQNYIFTQNPSLLDAIRASVAASSPWPRIPVLLLMGYWALRHFANNEYQSIFSAINLGIHEIGHVVFGPFGEFLAFAGGTILQLAAPIAALVMMLRQRDLFAVTFVCTWLATNIYGVALYMGDARTQLLPLVSLGNGDPMHDWAYLLGRLGLLQQDTTLAALVRFSGSLTFAAAFAAGAWLLWQMARPRQQAL